jgi:ATP-binding protein involved in chromosome partitioning
LPHEPGREPTQAGCPRSLQLGPGFQLLSKDSLPGSNTVVSTPSDVSLQDARKALEMLHQVNVEVLGIVENMSHFNCPHCHQEIDIFSKGGAERMARQFSIGFLGSIELDPEIRHGGDTGLPVALAGEGSPRGDQFFKVAEQVAKLAIARAGCAGDKLDIISDLAQRCCATTLSS